ncbi:hypothetical protein DXT68_04005 [Microbacterium foliorum]|uniref:Uncharacterized protein n=1 Tax=Microbacterium foliorum TaxID=104336 RepID=A0A0F0KF53_9MICO|nr:hypothetical protein [Microbacterium foliorum]AXL11390.1 hypothetical protein DXT68_04005 [Microbacterium foliorum]KJL19054.1 hypothetical protein RN50_02332 [Microbacterium foliorum]
MIDVTEYESEDDIWSDDNAESFEPETAETRYEEELGSQLHARLVEMFPAKVQSDSPLLDARSRIIRERATDEAAGHELVNNVLPALRQEILRQAADLSLEPEDWSVRYEISAAGSLKPRSDVDFTLYVTVLVVEGPVDPGQY